VTRRRGSPELSTVSQLRRRLAQDEQTQQPKSFLDWSLRVPEPKGELDFDRFPFQRELYADHEDPDIVVKKCTQIGISAWAVRWAMFYADVLGVTVLYVFPHQRQLMDFADTRIATIIRNSPYLRSRTLEAAVQNKMLKQIGTGVMYLRGSESVADLQSVDADVLVLDENDLLDQRNIPDAERRLGASALGLIRRLGVPSLPGFGIAQLYAESDSRRWHVRCGSCGERQPVTWHANVDIERCLRVCRRCRKPLDVSVGEWVAEFPDRDVRGYHVSRLIVPGLDVKQLVRRSRQTSPDEVAAFHNKDLGEEYSPADSRLTPEVIANAQRDYSCPTSYDGGALVTMGADVASVRNLNVRISLHREDGTKSALFIGEVESFDYLPMLMEDYHVHVAAIDGQPEHRLALAFAARYSGRVFLVHYRDAGMGDAITVDYPNAQISADRTVAIDRTLYGIRKQRNLLPTPLPPNYAEHLQAAARVIDEDARGRRRAVYRKLGADDYLHAEAYDDLARYAWDLSQEIQRIQQPTYVLLEDYIDLPRSNLGGYLHEDSHEWDNGETDALDIDEEALADEIALRKKIIEHAFR